MSFPRTHKWTICIRPPDSALRLPLRKDYRNLSNGIANTTSARGSWHAWHILETKMLLVVFARCLSPVVAPVVQLPIARFKAVDHCDRLLRGFGRLCARTGHRTGNAARHCKRSVRTDRSRSKCKTPKPNNRRRTLD